MDSATIDLQHQFYDMLMQSQYWPAERMRDYQRSQLAQLLRHAQKNVPFYENRLNAVLSPDGDIDWDRWGEIPIVKRSDLFEHREAMLARELPPGHGKVSTISSSGSTGLPIRVDYNRIGILASQTAGWRAHRWHDVDWSQPSFGWRGTDVSVAKGPKGRDRGQWGPGWLPPEQNGRHYDLNYLVPIDTVVGYMLELQPRYLTVTPKTAFMLATEFEKLGHSLALHHLLAFGARVEESEREAVTRVFGAGSIELYSSKEGQHMAYQCAACGRLHVNSELILLEILDDRDEPVAFGEQGRVVVTPFYNTAQPLIRYDTGDLTRWSSEQTCSISLPSLVAIEGRRRHMFTHPDGRRVSRQLPESARQILGALRWQMAQIGPTTFEVRYEPVDPQLQGDEVEFAELFRTWFFEDATVTFARYSALPLSSEGKLIEYVSELEPARITDKR